MFAATSIKVIHLKLTSKVFIRSHIYLVSNGSSHTIFIEKTQVYNLFFHYIGVRKIASLPTT